MTFSGFPLTSPRNSKRKRRDPVGAVPDIYNVSGEICRITGSPAVLGVVGVT